MTPTWNNDANLSDINQVLISGIIASQVHVFTREQRAIFTLHNRLGRFYVQYTGILNLTLHRGRPVLIRGKLFSVPVGGSDAGRIKAEEIMPLSHTEKESAEMNVQE